MTNPIFAALLLLSTLQVPDNWRDVQALVVGATVRVTIRGGDIEGTFVTATADELVVHRKRGNVSFDRVIIKRLDVRVPGSNRGRNIDRGSGIGFIAGLVRARINCDGCNAVGGSIIVVQSVLIGTLVGATASATKWETVYRR